MARKRTLEAVNTIRIELPGAIHDCQSIWEDFGARHSDWLSGFAADKPIYTIPDQAIDSLAKPVGQTVGPMLSSQDAEVERDFGALCSQMKCVGMLGNLGIGYQLFEKKAELPKLDAVDAQKLGWSPSVLALAKEALKSTDRPRSRLLGVAGWLSTEPAYLEQVQTLQDTWLKLVPAERPSFPLVRPKKTDAAPARSKPLSVDGSEFVDRLAAFLNRWGLNELTTWDLPLPQGPMLPDFPGGDALSRPPEAIQIYLPLHYAMNGDDDLQREILDWQRHRMTELGISESLAGLPHHEAYGQFFRVIHLERSIRSRFGDRRPRGLMGHIVSAIAAAVGIGVDRVQKIRKEIERCRGGKRASIKSLQIKS